VHFYNTFLALNPNIQFIISFFIFQKDGNHYSVLRFYTINNEKYFKYFSIIVLKMEFYLIQIILSLQIPFINQKKHYGNC
jgi:hypothetical protein